MNPAAPTMGGGTPAIPAAPAIQVPSATGIDARVVLAGPGARSFAFLIDWLIRSGLSLVWLLLVGGNGHKVGAAVDTYRQVLELAAENEIAIAALERLIGETEHELTIATVLEPVYQQTGDWQKQVGIYEKEPFESYFSGNTIQICPVGALTSAEYRFRSRPFDLVSTPGVAEHDACGAAIRVDHRRGKVMRRLSGNDPEVNEEWITDKDRFAFRYLQAGDRLAYPMVRDEGDYRTVLPVGIGRADVAVCEVVRSQSASGHHQSRGDIRHECPKGADCKQPHGRQHGQRQRRQFVGRQKAEGQSASRKSPPRRTAAASTATW